MSSSSILSGIKGIIQSKQFVVVFGLLAAIFSLATYTATLAEQREEFASLSTLGSDMKSAGYFPNDERTIHQGDKMGWQIRIHNGMDNAEYFSVRIKLLNSTQIIPNDTLNQPSPETQILELKHMVTKNSTWTVPFEWNIKQADREQDYVIIREVTVNGKDISNLNVRNLNAQNFKVVLELWRYDLDANDFVFAWTSGHDTRSVWNQIWFNVKA